MMKLGERIKAARERLKLTQAQAAEAAGLSSTGLSNLENGQAIPLVSTLLRLEKALGLEPGDLLRTPSGDAA